MTIHVTEYWDDPASGLDEKQTPQLRSASAAIREAAERWKEENSCKFNPLRLEGNHIRTRQWVGVVQVGDVTVEILPKKLHPQTLRNPREAVLNADVRASVMRNLLWMIDVGWCGGGLRRAGLAGLQEEELDFFDIFACLLSHGLLEELEAGVAHAYVETSDDLQTVRGRIDFEAQITQNWNRMDRVACTWDEFTPNTPMNRLFKCACRSLQARARRSEAIEKMSDCIALLDEVDDVSAHQVLADSHFLRRDRLNDRFWPSFELARRLLAGSGPELASGEFDTFTFLIDMNTLFADYVGEILRETRRVEIKKQKPVGYLLEEPRRMRQMPDYAWDEGQSTWIGDAKYKDIHESVIRLRQNAANGEEDDEDDEEPTQRKVSQHDVRQLITYGELIRRPRGRQVMLAIFYPYVGDDAGFLCNEFLTFAGSPLKFVPVRVNGQADLADIIPALDP